VLRDITTDDPSRLIALSTKFEEQVYKQARNAVRSVNVILISMKQDYFHLIASRMVNLKQRTKNKTAAAATTTQPQQQQSNLSVGTNDLKLPHSLQPSTLGMNVNPAGNNPSNLTQPILNKSIGVMNTKISNPTLMNNVGLGSNSISTSLTSNLATTHQPQPNASNIGISSGTQPLSVQTPNINLGASASNSKVPINTAGRIYHCSEYL
jgi:hypothetical protein